MVLQFLFMSGVMSDGRVTLYSGDLGPLLSTHSLLQS